MGGFWQSSSSTVTKAWLRTFLLSYPICYTLQYLEAWHHLPTTILMRSYPKVWSLEIHFFNNHFGVHITCFQKGTLEDHQTDSSWVVVCGNYFKVNIIGLAAGFPWPRVPSGATHGQYVQMVPSIALLFQVHLCGNLALPMIVLSILFVCSCNIPWPIINPLFFIFLGK